jgi:NAD(P)-dependent dehydrogenase (short-subunit alcohol dehydrogenase family)
MNGKARSPMALVTGGRRGIGAAIVSALAARGFDVVIADIEADAEADAAVKAVESLGRRARFIRADIADILRLKPFVDQAWRAFGTLDCLVNNAGVQVQVRGDLLDVTSESFDRLMNINVRGTFFLTQEVARRMAAEKRAPGGPHRSIVSISSVNAVTAAINRGEYCISKSALTMLNKLFALRLAGHGVHCYEIRPGVIATDMTAPAKERYDQYIAEGNIPIARWGVPRDIGEAVAALASGALPFSTGDSFAIDGGLHIAKM